MVASARLVAAAALARHESRGAQFRSDYPQTDAVAVHTRLTLADAERIAQNTPEAVLQPERAAT